VGEDMTKHALVLGNISIFLGFCLCCGVPHVPKILVVDKSNGSFFYKKNYLKKTVGTPPP
jgi:hypothetical protein